MAKGGKSNGKASKITLDVLKDHFHLPMAEVAKKFNVCLTYFKRVCRSHGVNRWPYRKIKSHQYVQTPEDDYSTKRSHRAYHRDVIEPGPSPQSAAYDSASPPPTYSDTEDSDYVAADGVSGQTSSQNEPSPKLAPRSAIVESTECSRKRKRKTVDHPDPYCALDILANAALAMPPTKMQHTASKVDSQQAVTFSHHGAFAAPTTADRSVILGSQPMLSSSTQPPSSQLGFALPPIQHLMAKDSVQSQQNYTGQVRHLMGQQWAAMNYVQAMASAEGSMNASMANAHLRNMVQATEGGFPQLNGSHLQQYLGMVGGSVPLNGMLRPAHNHRFSPAHAGSSQEKTQMQHRMNQMVW